MYVFYPWLPHMANGYVFRCSFDDDSEVLVEKVAQWASGPNVYCDGYTNQRIMAIIFSE